MSLIITIALATTALAISAMFNLHYRKQYKAGMIGLDTLRQKNTETFWLSIGLLMFALIPEAFGFALL